MIKKSLIALSCVAMLTTAASAGDLDGVSDATAIPVPPEVEPTGSLTGSGGAILPIALGVLVIAAVASSSSGSSSGGS